MTVREARPDEREQVLALRHEVFVIEQGVPVEAEQDADDEIATHLVIADGPQVLATCRLVPGREGRLRLGRMAVAAPARRRGLAGALLDDAAARALAGGFTTIVLHAQTDALGLYERAGYEPVGGRFMDCGIEHQTMEQRLG